MTEAVKIKPQAQSEQPLNVRSRPRRRPPAPDGESSGIVWISTDKIRPNRSQPRLNFESNATLRLADSVRRYGILQPLTVRVIESRTAREESPSNSEEGPCLSPGALRLDGPCFEIIAGERRFRAAVMLRMTSVPCVILEADERRSAELALVENLLREDLNIFEMAKAIRQLIDSFGLTQEEVAKRLSLSQSAVANKLRLLRYSDGEQQLILSSGLTERHARALLKISDTELRRTATDAVIKRKMNVSAAELYIDRLLSEEEQRADLERSLSRPKMKPVIKDIRLFFNSVDHAVDVIKTAGIGISSTRTESDDEYIIEIKIAKGG